MAVHTDNPTDCVEEVIRRFDTDDHFDPHSRAQLASLVYEALLPVVDHVEQLDTLPDGTVIHPLHATTATSADKRFGHWRVPGADSPVPRRQLAHCVPARLLHWPESTQLHLVHRPQADAATQQPEQST